jgi:hypothetical protein
MARRQQATSLELRGGDASPPALAAAGPADRGPRAAGPIYGWFTEGFDTADLQETKALLEELEG